MPFEGVDLVEAEVALAERLHAFHDVEQPATRLRRFIPEEQRLLPIRKHEFLGANEAVPDDVNVSRLRDTVEQDFRTDPPSAPRGRRQRLALLDDLADEEMLRHDEQVYDRKRFEIVVHQQKVRIVARGQAFTLGVELS